MWLMKSDCLSFEFLDALSPLIHTLIPTAWASDTCRDQKKKKDPRSTGSDGKTARQDPRSLGSHNIARIQDPRSKGSHSKQFARSKIRRITRQTVDKIQNPQDPLRKFQCSMQHPSKSWTLDPVCPLYPSIYYQKTLQEAKKNPHRPSKTFI